MSRLLIVDDDLLFCEALCTTLEGAGHKVMVAHNLMRARELLKKHAVDVAFIDVFLPDGNGLDLLAGLSLLPEAPEAIVITAQGDPEGAETAITSGAWDYVQKPASMDHILLMVERALEAHERKRQMPDISGASGIIGASRSMRITMLQMFEAAQSEAPVLVCGETGTGKELMARAVHNNSRRASGPFVVVDCGALSPNLLESELFGNVRGAFTGAVQTRQGLVMLADKGTLFLDEVGELALEQQKAFLRLIQERSFRPIGGNEQMQSNFRVVAATNRNLNEMAAGGTFRQDLLFRLQGVVVDVPPLRQRGDDIRLLALHALHRSVAQYGLPEKSFAEDTLQALDAYTWPGNVRELLHTVESTVLTAGESPLVLVQHLPIHLRALAVRSRVEDRSPVHTEAPGLGASGVFSVPATAKTEEQGMYEFSSTAASAGSAAVSPASGPAPSPASPLASAPPVPHPVWPAAFREQFASAPLSGMPGTEQGGNPLSWKEFQETVLYEHKRAYLLALLAHVQGSVPEAARIAGLSRQRLYTLLRDHGITRQWEQ